MLARLSPLALVIVAASSCGDDPATALRTASVENTVPPEPELVGYGGIPTLLAEFESAPASRKIAKGFVLSHVCVRGILDAQGRFERVPEGQPIIYTNDPPLTDDKAVADATPMTLHACGRTYTLTRGEFPEHAAINDLLRRYMQNISIVPTLPEELVAQLRARAHQAMGQTTPPAK